MLRLVARHDLVLAAGHLSRDEIFAVVDAAAEEEGVRTWDEVFAGVRAAGPGRSFFPSDLGQPFNPPVDDGLALKADRFLAARFAEDEVHTMAVTNAALLAAI